jgi:hypothetical protein
MLLKENASAVCKQEWNVPSLSSQDTWPRFFQVLPLAFELRISPFIFIGTSLPGSYMKILARVFMRSPHLQANLDA